MAPMAVDFPSKGKKEGQGNLILGRYELGKLLGQGTFAKVYVAKNVKSDESVAIKVLDKERILNSGLVAHIKREIAILRRVRHPNIVQLFEVMATKTKIYFVMEYVRGGELFGKVAKGRLKSETARRYFQQLISAVGFCHARGVFHRDLKPENLLLGDNGDLKVSDFGLSAVSDQIRQDGLFHTFCGTPAYVAPEVLTRKGYDGAKVDVWSCGVILFVLMAGYLPFHDQNVMAMYRKIYKGEFRCPKWFSSELTKLMLRLLDTNPQTRITIPEIMENRWFKKGFRHIRFYIENDELHNLDVDIDEPPPDTAMERPPPAPEKHDVASDSGCESDSSVSSCPAISSSYSEGQKRRLPRPPSLNAFDIISFSRSFDLSGLFEERGEEARFLSGESVPTIISKLEEIAKLVSFTVRKKDCRVSLEGTREGEKGPLTISAEIFELTPSLVVVEIKKKAGDRGEYEEFCSRELKPGLQNLLIGSASLTNISSDANQHSYSLSSSIREVSISSILRSFHRANRALVITPFFNSILQTADEQ
ncbi:CBL-interacting serine/threonine-protein kinase 12 [Apostasia shenzhenica]|uniref:non-specific serine/threonine protein kinase n=1 Tax=Apostasia shenzhenica TaxID=1088818 RepID=A0A2I0B0C0_9ASPA|nr:CBL-interacting serine/threonine-protein kinase 12 [Apostasia shenzhenica]